LKEAWRLCRQPHADLSGEGARLWGGRWNSPGRPVVYLADHPALAVLEVRVHLDLPLELLPDDYVLVRIRLPDEPPSVIREAPSDAKSASDTWLRTGDTVTLLVPSALVPFAHNLLFNPRHQRAAEAAIISTTAFRFDPRLWIGQTLAAQTSGTNA
jgi:RES domain-containing protein